jgi:1-deoxy-D-xylulose-5-phosphate reductoisomerase
MLRGVRRVALLGATGSIGRQAIDVVASHPELELCALQSRVTPLDDVAAAHGVDHVQVGGDPVTLLERSRPDIVLNAIVGFAGVEATLWALEAGVTLALANKESLVAAGGLATAAQERGGGLLLPVDSEHSALHQCLAGKGADTVTAVVLTASGGPFRGWTRSALADVTAEEALAHPTWSMGPKITIDSATLANKGLELIEAHWLFGLAYERIEVVVHPSSIVHGLVRFRDGALLAHVGLPDMRVPISYALTYPQRAATAVAHLELEGLTLAFEPVDDDAFPLLGLARDAGLGGGTLPCAFNAANEVAVAAFLEGRIGFLDIAEVVAATLATVDGAPARDLGELVQADREARSLAARKLQPA